MKVIFTGGGTGGHVNPAIALADKMRSLSPGASIVFVGTPRGIENKLVPKAGYPLRHVDVRPLARRLTLSNLRAALLAVTSVGKAEKLLREEKPDLVVGTGGYVCWPVLRAAAKMGIPTALHEANAFPGLTTRMLEQYIDLLLVCFSETASHLKNPEKAVRVGDPVRPLFEELDPVSERKKLDPEGKYQKVLLSCGGSMGAEQVNFAVLDLMERFTSRHPEILHIHGTGSIEYPIAKAMFEEKGLSSFPNIDLREYIYDMPSLMAASDLVVNRAGSMTLAELETLGKPCVLIPSPNVTDDHQFKNAKVLSDRGGALLIEEKDLLPGRLAGEVASLLSDGEKLRSMSGSMRSLAVPGACEKIVRRLLALIGREE